MGNDILSTLASLASNLVLLIPIGLLGFVRWAMWLLKRIPALFYRPIENDFDTTATIVTPVYNEDPVMFRRALDSWIANKPNRIIAVIDVTDKKCIEVARTYPEVDLLITDVPGKRPALAMGVDATTTEIVALVDSDVIWEPDVLKKLKMPFADPTMGGVGTRQHMYPTNGKSPTVWEKLNDIFLDSRYSTEIPATVLLGKAVSCLSGRTAAYRTKLLKEVKHEFLNETFNGRLCLSGEDKRYTCLTLMSGYRTWYQLNARIYSTFNPTFKGFTKQRIRWSRNSFRSDLRALWQGWVWRHPYLALTLIDKTVAPFTLLVGPVVMILSILTGNWSLALALLLWWLVSRAVKIAPHLWRRPGDLLILPFYILITFYMSLVKAYALFTINEHKWLTRDVQMVNNQAARVGETAQQMGTAKSG
ncbi:MAG: glycosyltransferase [Chloroflexi bacterium]|nr:glycosyltransferase [Chloroflexota bacterium]